MSSSTRAGFFRMASATCVAIGETLGFFGATGAMPGVTLGFFSLMGQWWRHFFSTSQKDPDWVLSPSRISKINTNNTFFPLATGQRGGRSIRAHCTRCVWKGGRKSTQVYCPSSAFWAERMFTIKWSLLRNQRE